MTLLHPVADSADVWRWCGPVVIAAVTGATYAAAVALLERTTGRPFNGSSYISDIREALSDLGHRARFIRVPSGMTLKRYLTSRTQTHRRRVEILRVSAHFIAVHASTYVDSAWSKCAIGSTAELIEAHPRKRVTYRLILEE